jgi:hypothetical protein
MLNAKKCSNLAEREGFEPSVPVTQYARLATPLQCVTNRSFERLPEAVKDLTICGLTATVGARCVQLRLAGTHRVWEVFPTLTPPQSIRGR